jgi:hypothetical protein
MVILALFVFLACALTSLAQHATTLQAYSSNQVAEHWEGDTWQDLHQEYNEIFKYGNRNAASHLWSTFLLERSAQMTQDKLEYMFKGFCAVSGSPVHPNDYKRYRLTLEMVDGSHSVSGFMYYCCWPCVCDTQDFIKIDTKTIETSEGPKVMHFTVLGNPCDHKEMLLQPFVQPFDGRQTTLAREAREVRCTEDGELIGATLSDNGYIIINHFFNATIPGDHLPEITTQTPGRLQEVNGVHFQDEKEWSDKCLARAAAGYNSGMGEIFRRVAAISPIKVGAVPESRMLGAVPDEITASMLVRFYEKHDPTKAAEAVVATALRQYSTYQLKMLLKAKYGEDPLELAAADQKDRLRANASCTDTEADKAPGVDREEVPSRRGPKF